MKHIIVLSLIISSYGVFGRNIPDNLIDCYTNETLLDRDNRLPASLTTLVDIIRKLEEAYSYDIRVLSTTLLNTFRVDGITFNPDITPSAGVSPYGIQGKQKEKHMLLIKGFLPENTDTIDVNLLTSFEKCALHFMLSDSIEFHKRGSENTECSKAQSNRFRKVRREAITTNYTTELHPTEKQPVPQNNITVTQPPQSPQIEIVGKESVNDTEVSSQIAVNNATVTEDNLIVNTSAVAVAKAEVDGLLPEVNEPPVKPVLSAKMVQAKVQAIEVSECPTENGVIYTKWGSLTITNVIAGIATGIQKMENVKFNDIYPLNTNENATSLTMDNRWAATLAGDLAEVVIHQGPKSEAIKVGTPGGWTDLMIPHWYFLNRAEQTQMTDAEIRGDLDGLIIAKNIESWRSLKPNLRLSQLLNQYYSVKGVLDTQIRACSRRDQYAAVTPGTEMRAQVKALAYTLYTYAAIATSMTVEAVTGFSNEAVTALNSYVTSLDSTSCSNTQSETSTSTNASSVAEVDLYVIIDSRWPFDNVRRILVSIAEIADLNRIRGSQLTVFTGNSFKNLTNASMSYVEFYQSFNKSSYDRTGDTGFDLKTLLGNHIRILFQDVYNKWSQTTSAGGPAPVVLFIPYSSIDISDADLNTAQQSVNGYWNDMPDITFLYLLSSGGDRVQSLVVSKEADIISYTMPSTNTDVTDLSKLDAKLKTVHKRITNSICSYNRATQSYSSAAFTDYVQLGYINYYKVNPKYLFGASTARIKVSDIQYGTVQVCYSRSKQYPSNNMPTTGGSSDITCLTAQGGNQEITLSSPCSGYEKILYCPPLYISILGQQSTGSECTAKECKYVTDIQLKISHEGLTCGVSQILANGMLIVAVLLAVLRSTISS